MDRKLQIMDQKWILMLTMVMFLLISVNMALGQEASGQVTEAPAEDHQASAEDSLVIPLVWWVAPIGSIIALIFAFVMYKQVVAAPEGDEKMKEIAGYVSRGAMAYLKRQYKVVAIFFAVVCFILFLMGWVLHVHHRIVFLAFLTGGFFSGLCGFLGMKTATLLRRFLIVALTLDV
ncbi:sodium/proton-translocating pyrophosphatase, partial [Planctomycetota bacterium]